MYLQHCPDRVTRLVTLETENRGCLACLVFKNPLTSASFSKNSQILLTICSGSTGCSLDQNLTFPFLSHQSLRTSPLGLCWNAFQCAMMIQPPWVPGSSLTLESPGSPAPELKHPKAAHLSKPQPRTAQAATRSRAFLYQVRASRQPIRVGHCFLLPRATFSLKDQPPCPPPSPAPRFCSPP